MRSHHAKLSSVPIIGLLLLCEPLLAASPVSITPAQPKQGTDLSITYDPNSDTAKLRGQPDIWVTGTLFSSEGSSQRVVLKMDASGGVFKTHLALPHDATYVSCVFVTRSGYDAETGVMVYRADGVPARDAYWHSMSDSDTPRDYQDRFTKEITNYPDNWLAYKMRWELMDVFESEALKKVLPGELGMIQRRAPPSSVEGLYTISYGWLLLGEEAKSRKALGQMMTLAPNSPFTAMALDDYRHEAIAHGYSGDGPAEVLHWRILLLGKNPDLDRPELANTLAYTSEVPLEVAERICHQWALDEPDNPDPYGTLARIYGARKIHFSDTIELANRALDLALRGNMRLYGDVFGKKSELLAPMLYSVLAEAEREQKHFPEALAAAKAARALDRLHWTNADVTEGEIWLDLGQDAAAESAFRDAWRRGSIQGRADLEALYEKRTGGLSGFEEYLNRNEVDETHPSDKTLAYDFEAVTLEGKAVSLHNLRGKVVVANFWFTGCAPCRAEIPEMNALVSKHRNEGVVFLAFSTDDDKQRVKNFLQEVPFSFQIVVNAASIAQRFGVEAYPTSIVIDREGKVKAALAGSGRVSELASIIDQAVKAHD